jgi:transposase
LGIAASLWTRRAVADLIRQEYGISLAVRTVGLYLERWGFTAKRPRRRARNQDPEEVRQCGSEKGTSLISTVWEAKEPRGHARKRLMQAA